MMDATTGTLPFPPPDEPASRGILRPGDTCWRLAHADRFAVIVDAAEYFAQAKAAMRKARHSILLIGWDFDLRIRLTPDDDSDGRVRLGEFLKHIVCERPKLRIHILKWDMAVLFTLSWQAVPMLLADLVTTRRIHLRFDSTHPATAAHHQKIVVIDGAIAFCGGIDMTDRRWDTRDHRPHDGRRVAPGGDHYGPWHDSAIAVDGEAARALDDLARQRWAFATGQHLPRPDARFDAWPDGLVPQMRDVDVGIARTMPAYEGRKAVHEVEALYLAAIRAARRVIYIESQFFAAARIADAIIARLKEPDGPEVVVVNPQSGEGWLEQETMDSARTLILERVRAADRRGRFRIYYPVNKAGTPVYVHSKVLIVDDTLLRIGSSNINNRSMGFNSECDLAVECEAGDGARCEAITGIRDGLVAEHLGVLPEEVARARREQGSLIGAIDTLRRAHGRTLRPLPFQPVNDAERAVVESRIANPERPAQPESRLLHAAKRMTLRHPLIATASVALLGVGAYAAWRSVAGSSER